MLGPGWSFTQAYGRHARSRNLAKHHLLESLCFKGYGPIVTAGPIDMRHDAT